MIDDAPKEIWVTYEDAEVLEYEPQYWFADKYIRADIVEGMREALEKISGFTMSQFANTSDMANQCSDVARAALAALKEEK